MTASLPSRLFQSAQTGIKALAHMADLQGYVDNSGLECLNAKPDKGIANALKQVRSGCRTLITAGRRLIWAGLEAGAAVGGWAGGRGALARAAAGPPVAGSNPDMAPPVPAAGPYWKIGGLVFDWDRFIAFLTQSSCRRLPGLPGRWRAGAEAGS